jgi:membrane protease subunit HflC
MRFMKLALTIGVVAVFGLAILLFLFTFNVRFTEVAVVTRFGRAANVYYGRATARSEGQSDPGLHFKWFYPIDSVTKYDMRARLVQMRKEAQQTADNRQVIVEAFCTWRVSDPIRFYERFSSEGDRTDLHYDAATDAIKTRLRTAVGEISRYRIDELFAVQGEGGSHPQLAELEDSILAALRTTSNADEEIQGRTGIEILGVGISSIVLPQETSKAVFERMKQDRQTLVNEITSQAESEAEAIKSAARTDGDRIEAFATVRATEVQAQGDKLAQGIYAQMAEHPELAVFLESIDFIREFYAVKTTLMFYTDGPFALFDPDAFAKAKPGEVPGAKSFTEVNQSDHAAGDQGEPATPAVLEEAGTRAGGGE